MGICTVKPNKCTDEMLNYLSEIKHENTPGGKLMDKFQQLTVDDALEIIRYWESLGNVNTYVGKSI